MHHRIIDEFYVETWYVFPPLVVVGLTLIVPAYHIIWKVISAAYAAVKWSHEDDAIAASASSNIIIWPYIRG